MNHSLFSHSFLLVAMLAAYPASAAQITWTTYDITGNESDVSTVGTLVNARGGGPIDFTVNGVTFQSIDNGGNLYDSLFNNDNISMRPGTRITGDYQMFLRFGQRSGRPGFGPETAPFRILPKDPWATVPLTGLTIGHTYLIQIWVSDTDRVMGNARSRALLLGNGAETGPVLGSDAMLFLEVEDGPDTSTNGTGGQYGIGIFVADATTQNFNVQVYSGLPTNPKPHVSDHFCNGWQLRDLGEGGQAAQLATATTQGPAAISAPTVVRVQNTESMMTLEFNQPMDKTSAINLDNYSISLKGGGTGSFANASLSDDGRTVTLTYGLPVVSDGSTYVIELGDLTSADGQPMTGNRAIEFRP